jgi:hypothetical protein
LLLPQAKYIEEVLRSAKCCTVRGATAATAAYYKGERRKGLHAHPRLRPDRRRPTRPGRTWTPRPVQCLGPRGRACIYLEGGVVVIICDQPAVGERIICDLRRVVLKGTSVHLSYKTEYPRLQCTQNTYPRYTSRCCGFTSRNSSSLVRMPADTKRPCFGLA